MESRKQGGRGGGEWGNVCQCRSVKPDVWKLSGRDERFSPTQLQLGMRGVMLHFQGNHNKIMLLESLLRLKNFCDE